MLRKILIFSALFLLAVIVYSCGQSGTTTNTSTTLGASTTTTTQAPIKGPDVGTSPNDNDQVFRSLAVSHISPEVVFLGSEGNGIFKSVDGGTNWTWLRAGLIQSNNSYPEIYETIIHPTNNNILYVATVPGHQASGVYKTVNGGQTWSRKVSGFPSEYMSRCISLDSENPNTLYVGLCVDPDVAGSSGAIYKSTNSAESWGNLSLASPAETNGFRKIIVWDTDNVYLVGTNFTNTSEAIGLKKSTDQGQTWTTVNTPDIHIDPFEVAPSNKNIIYIIARDSMNMHKTTNEGTSWTNISFYGGKAIEISPADPNLVLFSHTNVLYKTSDGMQTWTAVLTAEVQAGGTTNISDVVFAPSEPTTVYAAADGLRVYKSTDGGSTWTQIGDLRNYIDTH